MVASERLVSLGTGDDAPMKSCKLLSMRAGVFTGVAWSRVAQTFAHADY